MARDKDGPLLPYEPDERRGYSPKDGRIEPSAPPSDDSGVSPSSQETPKEGQEKSP
jgi:hypothetical protein